MRYPVRSGADCLAETDELTEGLRVGLMTNPTGVDHELRSTVDLLRARCRLTALFAVEHGIRGEIQAGETVDSFTDPETGIPVYSAYGKNSRFSPEMLDAFDVLVFDIQDVGARFYTYLYSLSYAMEACARGGKRLIVLDRINPLGGLKRTGLILEKGLSSFVGDHELLTQYGMTIGEYALYVKDHLKLDLSLTVIPLRGWERRMYLDDTDLPWVAPSPNCPDLDAALCYTGTCIFEGTNCSEGRGTTLPFRVIGAPWLDDGELEKRMREIDTPGIRFRRTSFRPTFSKHAGELCRGVQMHITDREKCDVFAAGLYLLDTIRQLSGDRFEFIRWPNDARYPFDKLFGTSDYRTGKCTPARLTARAAAERDAFEKKIAPYLLYR
ncbi:MAG: DUF1343 domain-containing protein [Clostridia bacterium]|nr:DUF1343 domain-containing protein [Clostridia bacterium]